MPNTFDQFDGPAPQANVFDRFDVAPPTPPREKPTAPGDSFLDRVNEMSKGLGREGSPVAQRGVIGEIENIPHELYEWRTQSPTISEQHNQIEAQAKAADETYRARTGNEPGPLGSPEAQQLRLNDPLYQVFMPGEGLAKSIMPAEGAGIAVLRNIAEGKQAGAPRPEATPDPQGAPPGATPEQPAQRAASPGAAPAATAAPPEAVRPSPSSPEPKSDIDAQLRALADPSHPKDSVFVARGNASALPPEAPPGVHMVRTPDGTLLTTDPEKATAFARGPRDDRLMARILGYPQPKDEVLRDIAMGHPSSVIQARDADGNVISEAVASDRGREATVNALSKHGQVVEMQTPEAIARRRRLLAQEQEAPPLGNEVERAPPWEPGPERPGMWNAPPAPEEAAEERQQAGRPVGEAQEPARGAVPAPAQAPRNAEEEPPFEIGDASQRDALLGGARSGEATQREAKQTAPRQRVPRRPENLIEFLARRGGLADDSGGDLRALGAHKKFVPGYGKLVRKSGGMSLDAAREAAEEAGYLQPGSDINDFLGALDDNLRGRHVFSDRDLSEAEEWRQAQWAERQPGMAAETAPFALHAESWRERMPEDKGWQDGKAIPWGKTPGVAQDLTKNFDAWLDANRDRYAGLDPHLAANLAAMHWLHEMGRDNPIEHLVTISGKDPRQSYAVTTGHFNTVQLPLLFRVALSREGNDLVVHHNHPTPWGLSASDLSIPLAKGARAILAHDVNGDLHGAAITDYGRRAAAGDPYQKPVTNWRYIMREAQIEIATRLHRLEKAGILSGDQLEEVGHELQGHALAAADMIDYVSSKPRPDYFPQTEWDEAIKAGAQSAIAAAFKIGSHVAEERALHERALTHALNYQPAVAGSADEGMARLLGKPPGRVSEAARTEPAGGHQGRAGDDPFAGQGRGRQAPGAQGEVEGKPGSEAPKGTQYRLLTERQRRPPPREMTITLGRDVGYASAGETYHAVQDKPGGRWYLKNARTGAGTDILPGEMQRGIKDGSIRDVTERREGPPGTQYRLLTKSQRPEQPPTREEFEGEGQRVIPGAEADPEADRRAKAQADKARAEQQTKGGLRPKQPQQDFGSTGLGGKKGEQGSLFTTSSFDRQVEAETTPEDRRSAVRKSIENILSPGTGTKGARRQLGLQREEQGAARRTNQVARVELERMKKIAAPLLGTPQGDDLMAYIEGRSTGAKLATPELQPIADAARKYAQFFAERYGELPENEKRAWLTDYFAHMWEAPEKAVAEFSTTPPKGGSGRFLKERSIPTYAEGIQRGLVPKYPNIVDGLMADITNKNKYLATRRVLARMRLAGTLKDFEPGEQPDGWTELQGYHALSRSPVGKRPYAPADAARVYNNMQHRGVYGSDAESVYDGLLRAKNFMTFAELSLSPFHALTMAKEAFVSDIARGIMQGKEGHPIKGAATLALSPRAPIRSYLTGKRATAAYLNEGAPDQLTRLAEAANISPVGRGESQYFAARRGYYSSVADFKSAMREAAQDIKGSPLSGSFRQFSNTLARSMDTLNRPLFDHYIPRLKYGLWAERMTDWIGSHADASLEDQKEASRDIADSIDNRLGEMNYDNIAWHTYLKQAAFLAMRAFGWTLGTWREIGGGMADAARGRFTNRVAYVIALPLGELALNTLLNYANTGSAGNPAQSALGMYNSGNKDAYGRPVMATTPGYMREMAGLGANVLARGMGAVGSYAEGKLASLWSSFIDNLRNEDWHGDPIANPNGSLGTRIVEHLQDLADHYAPLSFRTQQGRGAMSGMATWLGARKAPFAMDVGPDRAAGYFEKRADHPQSPKVLWRERLKREGLREYPLAGGAKYLGKKPAP